ncbi:DsbA family protein [Streptomyces sp. NPDC001661]
MNPANTTGSDDTVLYYGSLGSPHKLQVFLELRDRSSHRMAQSLLDTMRQGADEGSYVVMFHFSATLDDTVGGSGSVRGLSALAAASDVGRRQFLDYLAVLFEAQPFPPGNDDFAQPQVLLSLASKVNGLRSPGFDQKVIDDTYGDWAGRAVGDFGSYGVVGTPVCWYDDEVVPVVKVDGPAVDPQDFRAQLHS